MQADLSAVQPLDSTPSAPSVPGDEKALALVAHLSALVAPLLGPLIAYAVALWTRPSGHARQHAAAAVNFHFTAMLVVPFGFVAHFAAALVPMLLTAPSVDLGMMVLSAVGSLLNILFTLVLFLIGYGVMTLVFTGLACVAAGRGAPYAYPLSITLVR